MTIATRLISSLFNVASSRNVPFRQPQQLQCSHHGFTRKYLCSPLFSIPFSLSVKVTIWLWLRCETMVSAKLAGALLYVILFLERCITCWNSYSRSKQSVVIKWHTHFKLINKVCTLTIKHSKFSVMAGLIIELLFVLLSIYYAVQWAENEWIWSILANGFSTNH